MTKTTKTKHVISTDQLRRAIGLLLAKVAQKCRRREKRAHRLGSYGRSETYGLEVTMQRIRWYVEKMLQKDNSTEAWYAVHRDITDNRIRGALRYWIKQGKVQARRHGRQGNGYRWILQAEKKYEQRQQERRQARLTQQRQDEREREANTEATRLVLHKLSPMLGLDPETIKVWNNSITISREQAEHIIKVLHNDYTINAVETV